MQCFNWTPQINTRLINQILIDCIYSREHLHTFQKARSKALLMQKFHSHFIHTSFIHYIQLFVIYFIFATISFHRKPSQFTVKVGKDCDKYKIFEDKKIYFKLWNSVEDTFIQVTDILVIKVQNQYSCFVNNNLHKSLRYIKKLN